MPMLRYTFEPAVSLSEIEASLLLARWATEALHGEVSVELTAEWELNAPERTLMVDATSAAGRDFNSILLGFLKREFRAAQFVVERLAGSGSAS